MKKCYYLLASIAIILVTVTACQSSSEEFDDLETMQQSQSSESSELSAKSAKVDVCHWDADAGEFFIINISSNAYDKHIAHGDKSPENCGDVIDNVVDIEGNEYNVVQIGSQIWMAENLRTTKLNDGTPIDNIQGDTDWWGRTEAAYSWYNNDLENYGSTYGGLYNWYAVDTGKLAPAGWHIPTDEEWTILTDYLASDGHLDTEGTALKSTYDWGSDGNGTDNYGFTGLPGGNRNYGESFNYHKGNGDWWTSTSSSDEGRAFHRGLSMLFATVEELTPRKESGFSIRCVKD